MNEPINYKVWFYPYKKTDHICDHIYLRAYKFERHALQFARGAAVLAKVTRSGIVFVEYPDEYFLEVKG